MKFRGKAPNDLLTAFAASLVAGRADSCTFLMVTIEGETALCSVMSHQAWWPWVSLVESLRGSALISLQVMSVFVCILFRGDFTQGEAVSHHTFVTPLSSVHITLFYSSSTTPEALIGPGVGRYTENCTTGTVEIPRRPQETVVSNPGSSNICSVHVQFLLCCSM